MAVSGIAIGKCDFPIPPVKCRCVLAPDRVLAFPDGHSLAIRLPRFWPGASLLGMASVFRPEAWRWFTGPPLPLTNREGEQLHPLDCIFAIGYIPYFV